MTSPMRLSAENKKAVEWRVKKASSVQINRLSAASVSSEGFATEPRHAMRGLFVAAPPSTPLMRRADSENPVWLRFASSV